MYENCKSMERICIYPKDIQVVTGRTERYGRKVINKIRKAMAKEQHHLITIEEFCSFTGLSTEEVKRQLTL